MRRASRLCGVDQAKRQKDMRISDACRAFPYVLHVAQHNSTFIASHAVAKATGKDTRFVYN